MEDKIFIAIIGASGAIIGAIISLISVWLTVRTQRAIEETKIKERYKEVALEKRLEVHQEAFRRCRKILQRANKENYGKAFENYQNWWNKNCLYLGEKSRQAFLKMYLGLLIYESEEHTPNTIKAKEKFEDSINETLRLLIEEIGLPWLKEESIKS